MTEIGLWWQNHKPTRRRLIQLYAALLSNAHAKGFIEGEIYTGSLKRICVPGLNCYSCPGAVGSCPLGSLQNALANVGNRAPYYVLGILMLFGLILGRTICGWLCPMGLIQELLYKIPTPKLKKNAVTRALSWLKYIILAIFVVIIPLVYAIQYFPVPGFCKYICPAGTLEGAIGLLANPVNAEKFSMLGILFTRKFIILICVLTACVFVYRAFCRFLCPLGAIYGLFCKVSLLGVNVNLTKCTRCGKCVQLCPMDVHHVGDHECIHCGKCAAQCPTQAIAWKHTKSGGKRHPARCAILWTLAILLLAGVMRFANQPIAKPEGLPQRVEAIEDDAPIGKEIGNRAPSFSTTLYNDGGSFTLSEARGKVTIINFWATWCTPCVGELPYFQKAYETWPEDVQVIAIHSNLVTDDVQAFLDREGYTLPFGQDDASGGIIAAFGGSTALPMTVIVDRDGRIAYNRVGSISFEDLEYQIQMLL